MCKAQILTFLFSPSSWNIAVVPGWPTSAYSATGLQLGYRLHFKKCQNCKEAVMDRKDLLCFVLYCGSYKNRKGSACGLELKGTSQTKGIIPPGEEIAGVGEVRMGLSPLASVGSGCWLFWCPWHSLGACQPLFMGREKEATHSENNLIRLGSLGLLIWWLSQTLKNFIKKWKQRK